MFWTDELWNTVRELWEQGKTGGEICRIVPGLNRNSLFGKLFRHRRDGELAYRKPKAMTTKRPTYFPRRLPRRPTFIETYPIAVPSDASQRSFNSICGPSYDLQDLGMFECHWPIGDPGDVNFCYCAAPVHKRPYCPHHMRIAYVRLR